MATDHSDWVTIAEGTTFNNLKPTGIGPEELPHGTLFDVEMRIHWWAPMAPLADLFGTESFFRKFHSQTGAEILDVEGVGAYKIILHCKSNVVQLIPLLVAFAVLAGAIAFAILAVKVTSPILADLAKGTKYIGLAAVGLIIFILFTQVMKAKGVTT